MSAIAKRPGIVTFVAVVMLILAGFGLTCGICANGAAIAVPFIPDDGKPPAPEDPIGSALAGLRFIAKEVPGYSAVMIFGAFATLAFGITRLIAGIGLLRLRPSARKLSIVVTAISLLYGVGMYTYQGALVIPAQVRFEKEKPRLQGMPDMSAATMVTGTLQMGCGVAIQLTIAVLILVGLNTQSAKIAFGVLPPLTDSDRDDDEDRPDRRDHDGPSDGIRPGEPRKKYDGYEEHDD